MVADSNTDSQLLRGSPITSDVFKKRKANLLRKLKQCKVDDARRSRWIHQWKRDNVSEEDNGCSRLKALISDRFSQAWSIDDDDSDDDDETGLSAASSSPTSVDNDCFCCSKQVTEKEVEVAFASSKFAKEGPSESNNKSTSTAMPEEPTPEETPTTDQKKEDEHCPLCAEKMDATDLLFKPCSSCEYKMCLFCYHKIKEDTGVCPGCRTKYEEEQTSNSGEVTFQQPGGNKLPLASSFQALAD